MTFNLSWRLFVVRIQLQEVTYLSSDRCGSVVTAGTEDDMDAAGGVDLERFVDGDSDVTP